MSGTGSPSARSSTGQLALWFGVLAPPAAWFLHLSLSYVLVRYVCRTGNVWTIHLTTLSTLALALAATFVAVRAHRRLESAAADANGPGAGYARFLAVSGVVLGLGFGGLIAFAGIPPLVLEACG